MNDDVHNGFPRPLEAPRQRGGSDQGGQELRDQALPDRRVGGRRRLIRRGAILCLEIGAGLLAVTALAAGLAGWRLSQGPLELDALAPYVADAINESVPGVRVTLTSLRLAWDTREGRLTLEADNVLAEAKERSASVLVPQLGIGLRMGALLRGRLAPRSLTIRAPRLHLERDATGHVSAGAGGAGAMAETLLAAVAAPVDPDDPLGALREVRVLGAEITVHDVRTGTRWVAPHADIGILRTDEGVEALARARVEIGPGEAAVEIRAAHRRAEPMADVRVRFRDVDPTHVAQALGHGGLGELGGAVSGEAFLRLRTDGAVEAVDLDLRGAPGRVRVPDLLPEPLELQGYRVQALVDLETGRIDLTEIALETAGPVARLTATALLDEDAVWVEGSAEVRDMDMATLGTYWPPGLAAKARSWVTANITEGKADRAHADFALIYVPGGFPSVMLDRFEGGIAYSGLAVQWLKGMPKVNAIDGEARFGPDRLDLSVARGRMRDMAVRGAEIAITGLDDAKEDDEHIAIELDLGGPLATALAVVNQEPLRLLKELGFDASRIKGKAGIRLNLDFPLKTGLTPREIAVAASANLRAVAMPGLVAGLDLREGDLRLDVTGTGLSLEGTGALGGVPVQLAWQEAFARDAAPRRRGRARGVMDLSALPLADGGLGDHARGPVGMDLLYTSDGGRESFLAAKLDLGATHIEVPLLDWSKPAGVAATSDLQMRFESGRLKSVTRFAFDGGGLQAVGSFAPASELGPSALVLNRLQVGRNDVRVSVFGSRERGWRADVRGAVLDATPLLARMRQDEEGGEGSPQPPLDLTVALERVILGEGREIASVAGSATRDALGWAKARLEGRLNGHAPLSLQYGPEGDADRLLLRSTDAGAALHAFGLYDNVLGGELVVAATRDRTAPRPVLSGEVDLKDFHLVRAPVIARLLNAASLSGLDALLRGEGLPMGRLQATFDWSDDGLRVHEMRAAGGAVGLTAEGTLDFGRDRIDLQGVIVPVYGINQVIGAIPLLGTLLTGGEGQGLLAMTYYMSGRLSDPQVLVNPLAALAPGFLRNLFFLN